VKEAVTSRNMGRKSKEKDVLPARGEEKKTGMHTKINVSEDIQRSELAKKGLKGGPPKTSLNWVREETVLVLSTDGKTGP